MPDHTTYLSTSAGTWSVIHHEMPVCVNVATRADAEAVARRSRLTPTAVWNGDRGEFVPLES